MSRTLVATIAMFSFLLATALGQEPPKATGVVRKIDLKNHKITIDHGPIETLDMGPMTMTFSVPDSSLLESLKQGDSISFTADRVNGRLVVTAVAKRR